MPSLHSTNSLKTPVLFVIFNRPSTTERVFEAIRKARPEKLFVAADGPRHDHAGELEKCTEARKIATAVDWPCEVTTFFRDDNVGCGKSVSGAITWFFEHVGEGIILEDDCLPSETFFPFCSTLLERFRNDTRIMHIGGNNFLAGWQHEQNYSYYFSRNGHIWGWATWRRAWELFDFRMKLYEKLKTKGSFNSFFLNPLEKFYRMRKFNLTVAKKEKLDWWGYQWDFARFVNSGLAIVPQKNLVTNLGFGTDATHTRNAGSKHAAMEAFDIEMPLRHPPFIIRDIVSDKRHFGRFIKDVALSKLKL